jgi:hypothetical protein
MGFIRCPSQRQWEPLAFLPYSASVTQGGAGSPPPLVEVNQAILAWSFLVRMGLHSIRRVSWFVSPYSYVDRWIRILSVGGTMF